jgi:hypothetical protein
MGPFTEGLAAGRARVPFRASRFTRRAQRARQFGPPPAAERSGRAPRPAARPRERRAAASSSSSSADPGDDEPEPPRRALEDKLLEDKLLEGMAS